MSDVLIDPIVVHDWHYVGTTFTLRIFSDRSWVALGGSAIPGRGDTNAFYREYTIAVAGTDATIPAVSLAPQTSAPNEKNARYTAYFYVDGVEKDMFLASSLGAFQVPAAPTTTDWAALEQYNFRANRRYYQDENTYSRAKILELITASSAANFVDATTAQKGVGKLSTAAATPTSPIFVGDNDRRVQSAYNVTATAIGANNSGNVDNLAALDALANTTLQITGAGGEIYFPAGSYLISSDMSFPANVSLRFDPRAMLKPATGAQVTILGPINAGPWKIFTNATAGLGTILFTSSHRLNTLYPEWWGALADNSTDNAATLQAAVTAHTTLGGGTMQFASGIYRVSTVVTPTSVFGQTWQGAGRINTIIKATGTDSAVRTNGFQYSKIIGMQFTTANALTNKAPFELDGDGSHGVQANTFVDVLFVGNLSTYAYAGGRSGQSWQGSENLFLNCHWSGATSACYFHTGSNAINNTILGGDMQVFQTDGVRVIGGSVSLRSVSFESTYGYTQIVNDGWDINASAFGVSDFIIVEGCRSESLRFYHGASGQAGVLIGNTGRIGFGANAAQTWTALTPYTLNQIVVKSSVSLGEKLYRVTTAGTSGASEPTWPNSGTVADGGAVWTETEFNVVDVTLGMIAGGNLFQVGNWSVATWSIDSWQGLAPNLTAAFTVPPYKDPSVTYFADATAAPFTITISGVSPPPDRQIVRIATINSSANGVSVTSPYGNGIAGSATVVIPGGAPGYLILQYDSPSSAWEVIGKSFGLNAATLNGATFAAPGAIGGGTPGSITGTTITANTGFAGPLNGTLGGVTPAAASVTVLTISGLTNGVRVYQALITQSSTGAPTAVIAQNQLSGIPVLARSSTGTYTVTLAGAFLSGKTFPRLSIGGGVTALISPSMGIVRTSNDVLTIKTGDTQGGALADDLLTGAFLEIITIP